jgi:hypothetical protein
MTNIYNVALGDMTMTSTEIKAVPSSKDEIDAADSAIRMLANDLHRLNQSVSRAVEAGVTVELIRSSRHHSGTGNWGDLLVPVITKKG